MKRMTVILTLGLVLTLSACANASVNTASDTEASVEVSVNNEDVVSETAEASTEVISEAETADSTESASDSVNTFTSATNESSEKKETSDTKSETASAEASESTSKVDSASADTTVVKTSAASGSAKTSGQNSSLMAKFPVIDYPANGTGRGPGANFRKGHDYENHEVAGGKVLGELNWWELTTWTASNGVVLKVLPADQGFPNGAPIIDGCGLDNVPGSDFLLAVAECLGTNEYWSDGNDMSYHMTVVPVSQIPAASAKRTSIDVNDATLLGYKANYESIMNSAGGTDGDFLISSNKVTHRNLAGVEVWAISYDSGMGAWEVRINVSSPYQYTWDGIKNILKYVNPDGEALYNVIYEDFYVGSEAIQEWDSWWPVANSYIYQPDNTGLGYAAYYVK